MGRGTNPIRLTLTLNRKCYYIHNRRHVHPQGHHVRPCAPQRGTTGAHAHPTGHHGRPYAPHRDTIGAHVHPTGIPWVPTCTPTETHRRPCAPHRDPIGAHVHPTGGPWPPMCAPHRDPMAAHVHPTVTGTAWPHRGKDPQIPPQHWELYPGDSLPNGKVAG